MKIKKCTSCGHDLTTENSKHIGDQKLPDTAPYKGKRMALYNCPKCDSTVTHLTDNAMQKATPTMAKEGPALNYAEINKIKPQTEPKTLDYSSSAMKRDPKKDPNWKQGVEKAKLANQTKNNPNIVKGINDQHYVVPKPLDKADDLDKSALPSSPYNNEVEAKIASIKEKYAPKGPLSMEDKVQNLKDRYNKVPKPSIAEPQANPTDELKTRSDLQKLHSRHRALKGA